MMDWSNVLENIISDSTLDGYVVIGVSPPPSHDDIKESRGEIKGIHKNGMIYNCILEPDCVLYDNTIVSYAHIHSNASILHCGVLSFANDGSSDWTDEISITLGAESGGGRSIKAQVENTLIDICHKLHMSSTTPKPTKAPHGVLTIPMNIISSNSYIRSTPTLQCIYLSSGSYINSATSVSHSILLPHSSISNSSTVSHTFLQWNASISSSSFVEESLLMEHSHIGPSSSIISNAILGPDVHVSAGEVHASLLGPNTNAHHQSLIIGLLWPLGRGNVGYGSNIGSNHTGRLPDQENAVGEGIFWGLSCIIKYPLDLTYSPYSIVAAGAALDPQRIAMPFSLILSSTSEVGKNEIIPGWLLQSSPYTIVRSETKFQQRRKAKRHSFYTGWKIIRPSVVNLCYMARQNLLMKHAGENDKTLPKKVSGIGRNSLTERSQLMGIKAYTDMIQRYALRGLLDQTKSLVVSGDGDSDVSVKVDAWLSREFFSFPGNEEIKRCIESGNDVLLNTSSRMSNASWPVLPWEEEIQKVDDLWHHQRFIIQKELSSLLQKHLSIPSNPSSATSVAKEDQIDGRSSPFLLKVLLSKLVQLETDFAARVYKSKHRDDIRGKNTVPGYEKYHVGASDDPVIVAVQKEAKRVEKDVVDVLRIFSMSLDEYDDKSGEMGRSRSRL
mmetsp:Transcript_35095/g.52383  ORF Transcript_35095/g.52383 Transcript_35095/m.52383 type:complete len:670 (+) Transcript_35095:76-2085(+)